MLFFRDASKADLVKILTVLMLIVISYTFGGFFLTYLYGQIPIGQLSGDYINTVRNFYGNNIALIAIILPWVTAFLGAILGTRYILKWPVPKLFTTERKINYRKIAFAGGLWFLINTIVLVFFSKGLVWNFRWEDFLLLFIISITLIAIQCVAEELLFRSFLVKLLGAYISHGWLVALLTGLLFGALHVSNPEMEALGNLAMIYYVSAGLILGFIVIVDNGIEITTGFHIANNLSAALLVTTNWQVFRTDAIFVDESAPTMDGATIAVLFISLGVFVILIGKKYNFKKGLYRLGKCV